MKKRMTIWFVILVISLLFYLGCSKNGDSANKILVVHSYNLDYEWTKKINDGIDENLEGKDYIVETYFMDTKRHTSEEFKINSGKKALQKVKSFKPDVIIASDDNAQEYFGKIVVEKFDIPLVFCGVNSDIQKYNYGNKNVTGILERPKINKTLNILEEALGSIDTYTIINDNSPTAVGFIDNFILLEKYDKVKNTVLTNDFMEWKSAVNNLDTDALIIFTYHTIEGVKAAEVMKWTRENVNIPSVGFLDFSVSDGLLMGVVESGYEHGKIAANMAGKILDNTAANKIKIVTASQGKVLVNKTTAEKLGLDLSQFAKWTDEIIE